MQVYSVMLSFIVFGRGISQQIFLTESSHAISKIIMSYCEKYAIGKKDEKTFSARRSRKPFFMYVFVEHK